MLVATVNIRNLPDMPRPFVVEDAAGAGEVCDVMGLQEIGEVEDYDDVRTGLGPDWVLDTGGMGEARCDTPVAYNGAVWEPTGTRGYTKLHDGHAKMSLPKWLVWTELRRIARPELVVRFASGHFVANVWGRGDDRMPDHDLRVQVWTGDWATVDAWAAETVAAGVPAVVMLDANRRNGFEVPAGGMLAYGPSIEKITAHPAGRTTFTVVDHGDVEGHSDHPVRWARLRADLAPVMHPCPTCGLEHFAPGEAPA